MGNRRERMPSSWSARRDVGRQGGTARRREPVQRFPPLLFVTPSSWGGDDKNVWHLRDIAARSVLEPREVFSGTPFRH